MARTGFLVRDVLLEFVRIVLRPVVRFCLKHQVGIQDLTELAKREFICEAERRIKLSGDTPNVSRLAILTGLRRREVERLRNIKDQKGHINNAGVITRVIGRWISDNQFIDSRAKPRLLTYKGTRSEFYLLVGEVTSDISPGSVLAELQRVGAVKMVGERLKLITEVYVPKGDKRRGFELLALDVDDLIGAVQENVLTNGPAPNHHATTEYTNIPRNKIKSVRRWILREGDKLHTKTRKFLSKMDRDINPNLKGDEAVRVVFGSFSRITKADNQE